MRSLFVSAMVLAASAVGTSAAPSLAQDELVETVVGLIADKDKDLRAVGLEQVRMAAKGAENTKRFAAQLEKISPAAQVDLLSALADRADPAARKGVVDLLAHAKEEDVRAAAVAALGPLGEESDFPLLFKALASTSAKEKAAARSSLIRLEGAGVSAKLADKTDVAPDVRVSAIEILGVRRAAETCPQLVTAAQDKNPQVRAAAMSVLGQLASTEQIAGMLQGVLKAEPGKERDAAEKSVALVCSRTKDSNARATPVLTALTKMSEADQLALLPTVGRVGGAAALAVVDAALSDANPARREAALQALARWPDASVADKLLALAEKASDPAERKLTFEAFARVSSIRDKRTDKERLDRMKQAMALAKTEEEKAFVITRSRTAYLVESLRFVLPYLKDPKLAQTVCETTVELAHHRGVREPNKAEFDKALDQVLAISKDPVVKDRATRYKKGQTWERPKVGNAK